MATKEPKVTTQLNTMEAELAKYAEAGAATETVGVSNFISTRGGRLSYKNNDVPGNKINVIVIASMMENHYYEDRFDPDNPASPKCFAFSENGEDMAPHELSEIPQNPTCAGCQHNEWGSADVGRGKACKNIRRLGLITEDELEDVEGAEMAQIRIPVTSVKEWGTYVNSLFATLKRPPFAVLTEVSVVPDAKTQFKIKFKLMGQVTDEETIQAIIARRPAVLQELSRPYQPTPKAEEAKPVAGGKAGNTRKY